MGLRRTGGDAPLGLPIAALFDARFTNSISVSLANEDRELAPFFTGKLAAPAVAAPGSLGGFTLPVLF